MHINKYIQREVMWQNVKKMMEQRRRREEKNLKKKKLLLKKLTRAAMLWGSLALPCLARGFKFVLRAGPTACLELDFVYGRTDPVVTLASWPLEQVDVREEAHEDERLREAGGTGVVCAVCPF